MLVTKGDLVDQRRKLTASGLGRHFAHVEIVPDKTPEVYGELLRLLDCPPERFLMVGNSEVSDIAPVLALGGWAVHVPFRTTWALERAEPVQHDRRLTVASLARRPAAAVTPQPDQARFSARGNRVVARLEDHFAHKTPHPWSCHGSGVMTKPAARRKGARSPHSSGWSSGWRSYAAT